MSARPFSFVPLILFALWLLWFLLPPTHNAAQNQWKSRLLTVPTSAPYSVVVAPSDTSRDAVFVRALDSPGTLYPIKTSDIRWKALEAAGRRFPNDAAICAAQIVSSTTQLHLGQTRQPGYASSGDPNWSVRLVKVQAPDPQLLKSWFEATARGAKLEPNNTFWDWAQIIGLLAARRDSEVWPVLRAARNKKVYDDHINEATLARLRLAPRQLNPIQEIGIAYAALFPHYATMREAAREIGENASGLRLTGQTANQKMALEGLYNFVHLGRLVRRESKTFIGSLVGTSLESIAMFGGAYNPLIPPSPKNKKPRLGAPLAAYASHPQSLLLFARRMGRNDIATQLGNEWVEMGKWQAKTRPAVSSSTLIGINTRDMFLAQSGDGFGPLLIAGLPTLFVLALCCSLLLRFIPSWRRESEVLPTPLSWVWGGALSLLALVILCSGAIYALMEARTITGSVPLDLLLAFYSGSGNAIGTTTPPIWQYHFSTLLALIAALWLASLWDARRHGNPTLWTRLRGLFHAPDDGLSRFDAAPLLILAALIGAVSLLTVGVVAYLIIPSVNDDYKSLHDYAGLVLLGLAVILALPSLLRLRTPPGRTFALILARRFAWGQLIFLTLVWGILWMLASPAQHRFDAQFFRQQQLGEFQLIRKQVGL